MAYQVLARKWRPQNFASLIGQQAAVTALTNALRDGRIAQAYLFSGIRGVGKTTAARVFAKALNCERGMENGPCNDCPTCDEITKGADMDVLEIDAATYSKVEQVRELAESLKYGPARDRYKVVVLDEVHRLSRQAFDALLKIVEEPPPRLVFIFATTEIDAVPATILSRCQEFHFRRVSNLETVAHLRHICAEEKITASDAALSLLARAGEGSVRDAVALLDQLATFGNGTVDEQEAIRLLGGIDLALFQKVLAAVLAGETLAVSRLALEVEENGWDPRTVHAHFLSYCRDALHLALGEAGETLALPAEERRSLAELAKGAGYENLLRLLHHLLGSESAVRRSESGTLALEIAWLRAAELPRLVAIESILSGAGPGTPAAPAGGRPAGGRGERPEPSRSAGPPPPAAQASAPAPRLVPPPEDASPPSARPASPVSAAPAAAEARPQAPAAPLGEALALAPAVATIFTAFIEQLVLRRPTLAALFEDPATLSWNDGERTLLVRPVSDLAASSLHRNRELISTAAAATFGAGVQVRFSPPGPHAASESVAKGPGAPPTPAARKSQIAEHPRVQAVLEIFGGGVSTVEAPAAVLETLGGALGGDADLVRAQPAAEYRDEELSPSEDPFQ
jgi:DNA polymerase-3 subunit gamma/tau